MSEPPEHRPTIACPYCRYLLHNSTGGTVQCSECGRLVDAAVTGQQQIDYAIDRMSSHLFRGGVGTSVSTAAALLAWAELSVPGKIPLLLLLLAIGVALHLAALHAYLAASSGTRSGARVWIAGQILAAALTAEIAIPICIYKQVVVPILRLSIDREWAVSLLGGVACACWIAFVMVVGVWAWLRIVRFWLERNEVPRRAQRVE